MITIAEGVLKIAYSLPDVDNITVRRVTTRSRPSPRAPAMAVVTSKLLASAAIMQPPGMPSCRKAHCVSGARPALTSVDSVSPPLSSPLCRVL